MTNKDYERLTYRPYKNDKVRCLKPDGEEEDFAERLYELENAIENGTLAFLPCKVDDKFWWILNKYSGDEIVEEKVKQIRICNYGLYIIDYDGSGWYLNEIYFTKEAARKALEELEK